MLGSLAGSRYGPAAAFLNSPKQYASSSFLVADVGRVTPHRHEEPRQAEVKPPRPAFQRRYRRVSIEVG